MSMAIELWSTAMPIISPIAQSCRCRELGRHVTCLPCPRRTAKSTDGPLMEAQEVIAGMIPLCVFQELYKRVNIPAVRVKGTIRANVG